MGGKNSNPLREGGQLLTEYNVTGKNAEQFLTFLTHKHTQKQYVLREVTFTEQRQVTLTSERMKNRKLLRNQHLTHLERVEERTEDNMCSHYQKIYTLWEHPSKSLAEEVNQRALQRKPFENKELWSILACSIMGLSTLQQNDIRHECLTSKNILMDNGNIKIADPLSTGLQTNFQALQHNRTLKNIYLSPEQCEAMQSQKPIISKNSFKNDVFTLAMILLQCGLLERQDQCYLDDCSKLNWNKISTNLNRFGLNYQDDLRQMIALMLTKDIRNRPDWLDLSKFVNQNNTGSATNFNNNQYSTITNQTSKRDHFITRTVKSLMPHKNGNSKTHKPLSPTKNNTSTQPVLGGNKTIEKQPQRPLIREASPVREGYPYPGFNASLPSYRPKYEASVSTNISRHPPLPNFNYDLSERIAAGYTAPQTSFTLNYPSFQLNPVESKPHFSSYQAPSPPIPSKIDHQSPGKFSDYIRPAHSINYELQKTNSPQNSETMTLPFDHKLTKTREIADTTQIETQPQYVTEHFKVGSKYQGYKLNGMRHGAGKFYYQDGGFYDGEWKNNKMEGQGTLYYQSNNKAYEGSWINDQFHGQGTLYNDNPKPFDDYIDFNTFDQIDELWQYYQGNFDQDQKDGKGKLQFINGQYFEGTFKKDMVEGQGTFYCMDGRQVHGIWHQNQLTALLN